MRTDKQIPNAPLSRIDTLGLLCLLQFPLFLALFIVISGVDLHFVQPPYEILQLPLLNLAWIPLKTFALEAIALLCALFAMERRQQKTGRAVFWPARLGLIVFTSWLVLFHISEYYFFQATGTPLNLNIIVDNIRFVHEDAGYVSHVPLMPILLVLCIGYELIFLKRFRIWVVQHLHVPGLRKLLRFLMATMSGLIISMLAFLIRDFAEDARRASVEYFRPYFVGRDAVKLLLGETYQGPPPVRASLLSQTPDFSSRGSSLPQKKYNVVAVTIESFNQIYLHPEKIHPALTSLIMPNFEAAIKEGLYFDNIYSASAPTMNGYISDFCSQMTMREKIWEGQTCLPKVLGEDGYQVQAMNSFVSYAPKHLPILKAIGMKVADSATTVRAKLATKQTGFMYDQEVFEDSIRLLTGIKEPFFFHISTNQMHQPGYVPPRSCPKYAFPAGLELPPMTLAMIQSAHCTDFYLKRFLDALRPHMTNTIVYVTADHSTNIPLQVGMDDDISRIPLLFFLPLELRQQLTKIDTHVLGATYDFVPSIADLLGRPQAADWLGTSLFHARARGGVESVSELDKVGVRRTDGSSATAKFTNYGERFTFFDQSTDARDDEALRRVLNFVIGRDSATPELH